MPFRSMIRRKFWLSANYPGERHAFLQDNPWKVLTFRGFTIGKPALTQKNSRLHAFPWIILQKDMAFRSIIRGKFWLSENYTPERHAFLRYNPRKVLTFHGLSAGSQTSCTNISANLRKNNNQFLDVHQGPNETKKSHATVPLTRDAAGSATGGERGGRFFRYTRQLQSTSRSTQTGIQPDPLFAYHITVLPSWIWPLRMSWSWRRCRS